jgi:hypothetical protein
MEYIKCMVRLVLYAKLKKMQVLFQNFPLNEKSDVVLVFPRRLCYSETGIAGGICRG